MATSPTQRSLAYLRAQGLLVTITEHWNPHVPRADGGRGIRQDLFGFADLVALDPSMLGLLAVQTTSGANVAARVTKILALNTALVWLATGNRIVVHGWRKAGPRGKRQTWQVREEWIRLEQYQAVHAPARPTEE